VFRPGIALVILLLGVVLAPGTRASDARSQIELVADPAWASIADISDGRTPTPASVGSRYLLAQDVDLFRLNSFPSW